MKTRTKPAAAAAVAAATAEGIAPDARLRDRMRRVRQACRQIFGIPDYERYLEHCATHHPDEKPLSQREFFARSIDRKYGKSGPRCC